jgi:hypothetical protein
MKNEEDKIDMLVARNAAEQLAKVDWEQLGAVISRRLDQVGRGKAGAKRFAFVPEVAAGLAAAAAVILVLVMATIDKPGGLQLEKGGLAVVKYIEVTGSASIEISRAADRPQVMVDVGAGRRGLATCDVEIIDLNGDLKDQADRGMWIIISRTRPVFADNGTAKDMRDLICLF